MARFVVTVLTVLALTAAGASGSTAPRPDLISFADAGHGVASFSGTAGWTTDGGRTWHLGSQPGIASLAAVNGTRDVWAAVAARGAACSGIPVSCRTRLARSIDGGATWTTTAARLLGPAFSTRRAGWAFRPVNDIDYGRLVATDDSGRNWRPVADPCPRAMGKVAAPATPRHGWLLCLAQPGTGEQGKALYETRDAARHWRLVMNSSFVGRRSTPDAVPIVGYPFGIDVTARGIGLLWEARGNTYATRNGGRTWRKLVLTSPEVNEIHSASVVNDHLAFALLRNGRANRLELLRSDDGLRHWRVVRSWPLG